MIELKTLNVREQSTAAARFAADWKGKGYEKGETQVYWIALLRDVLGVQYPDKVISFEKQVRIDGTVKFIDGYMADTRILIEQKNLDVDLHKKHKQSDGQMLTPYRQALRYAALLPFEEKPRWIVVCNFQEIHVHNQSRPDAPPEVIRLEDLEQDAYRLQFLVQNEAEVGKKEKELSFRAGELVGLLYDALLKGYKDPESPESQHSLNALCVRLVFCLYAEDAGLFGRKKMFHDYLEQYRDRPKDVRRALMDLFDVLDTKTQDRDPYLDEDLAAFPYVNGSLFANASALEVPQFTQEIVDLLLSDASDGFDWSQISPTIFGAVFESTLNPETRRKGGMHYTSTENIHRVIDPLFLDDLRDELATIRAEKIEKNRSKKLKDFQEKLASLTFFDPACGSGNFLTETYLSIRQLENEVLRVLSPQMSFSIEGVTPIKVTLEQFYGIEINDFACAVAKTALWIAESQMMQETEYVIAHDLDFLPLKSYTNICEANALRVDWSTVVPRDRLNYIIGNPPFVGHNYRTDAQKEDLKYVFKDIRTDKSDYVIAWLYLSAKLIKGTTARTSLVATNSVCQGSSVGVIWKQLFQMGMQIDFAWRTFVWKNESDDQASVQVVIVGFSDSEVVTIKNKRIFIDNGEVISCKNINGYLEDSESQCFGRRSNQISGAPEMKTGSLPRSKGFTLTEEQRETFIKNCPKTEAWIRPYIGSDEFLNGGKRYCLWLKNVSPADVRASRDVMARLEKIKEDRAGSKAKTTQKKANTPMYFVVDAQPNSTYLAVPQVSSEKRFYLPMGFVKPDVIASNLLFIVPGAKLYHFGVLMSSVHMAWLRAVSGRLEMRYRYLKDVVYNNFVWPDVDQSVKEKIEKTARGILQARANHEGQCLADLYDDLIMPEDMREAHIANDRVVLKAYGLKANATEEQIVSHLTKLFIDKVAEADKREAVEAAVRKVLGVKETEVPEWMVELRKQCLDGTITTEELIANGKAKKKELAAAARKAKKEAEKAAKNADTSAQ